MSFPEYVDVFGPIVQDKDELMECCVCEEFLPLDYDDVICDNCKGEEEDV